jgi:flagellar assembly protein FliH
MSELGVRAWIAPELDEPVLVEPKPRYSVAELDAIGQQAWEEGFARGLEAGTAAGLSEQKPHLQALSQQVRQIESVLDFVSQPLDGLDELVEVQLAELSCSIARHVVRRELRIDPSQVIAAVRATVALLPIAARDVRVHLHPEDASILRERLSEPQSHRAWTLIEDPVLERGGCRIVTDDSQIDGRVETRLGAVIASVLGDPRGQALATQDEPR